MIVNFLEYITESIGIKIEQMFDKLSFEKKQEISQVVGKHLVLAKKRKSGYNIGDTVLLEYWYNGIITPVKILDKESTKYKITHNISESKIFNAPDELIPKSKIIDFYIPKKEFEPIDTSIKLSNAIEALPLIDQKLLLRDIERSLKTMNEAEETEELGLYGKAVFSSFLKILSAINTPNDLKQETDNIPKDFLYYYWIEDINKEKLRNVFKRFKTMDKYLPTIEKATKTDIFFGIKNIGRPCFQYGIICDKKVIIIGEYILKQKMYEELKNIKNVYLTDLKENLKSVTYEQVLKLAKIQKDLTTFSPSYYIKKTKPFMEKDYLCAKYYGIGKWDSGVMLTNDFENCKKEFKTWASTHRLKNIILFNLKAENFWVIFKIKIQ